MAKSFFIKDKIEEHFRDYSKQYFFSLIVTLIGVIVGLILCFSDYSYISILNSSDKNMFDYITGQAEYSLIFKNNIKELLLCVCIIMVFNITKYTSFLSYLFIGYQMCLTIMSVGAIITIFGFAGILNVVLFILPINLANYLLLNILNSVCVKRCILAHKYKYGFISSFKENNTWLYIFMCLLALFVVCLIYSYILPLVVKSFVIIIY